MNSSLSISTESQYSATSAEQQAGGGIFSFLFGSEKAIYATELVLKAFNDKALQVACYVIRDSVNNESKTELDYSQVDKNGRSILHFLVLFGSYAPDLKQLLLDVLGKTNAKKYINLQDAKKNTCAHYAMYANLEDVVKVLAQYGADLSIKNGEGFSIQLESIPVKASPSDIFMKITKCDNSVNQTVENSAVEDRLNSIVKMFLGQKNLESDSGIDTIGFRRDQLSATDTRPNKPNRQNQFVDQFVSATSDDDKQDLSSIDVLNALMDEIRGKPNAGLTGGAKKRKGKKTISTKKSISGKRRMTTYSEVSFGGSSDNQSSNTSEFGLDGELSDDLEGKLAMMARAVNNKANEAHANAVLRIKEIMGLEDEEARAVKAILYDKIKKEHPEYSNADKAMELEKMASDKAVLKDIKKPDIKKMIEIIKEKRALRETTSQSSDDQPRRKPKMARASRAQSRMPREGVVLSEDSSSSSSGSSSNSDSSSSNGSSSLDTITMK